MTLQAILFYSPTFTGIYFIEHKICGKLRDIKWSKKR